MGTQTLPTSATVASGLVVKSADFLTVISALEASFVGRNTSGVATSGQSLGTALYPWGNAYITDLIVGGSSIDVSGLAAAQNRIISGATRSTSGQPDFLAPAGSAATVTVEGATTTLTVAINGTTVEVTTDIAKTGLTLAPATNNTCAINDASFTDQAASKYYGEIDADKTIITIDTVGTEISSRVGQMIALKTGTSEIMLGWLKSATELVNVRRGYFFDSSGNPIVRETLANNDTLTLLSTGWVFITDDALTVDVSYTTPVYGYTAPGSPSTGDYWYDLSNQTWKRYSGASFEVIDRTLLGVCVIDTTNCIGARSFDFDKSFKDTNTIDCEVFSDTVVRSVGVENNVNIYGTDVQIPYSVIDWDNSSNMETGSVAADTTYYLYLDTDGQSKISTERPYDRWGDLRGRYHPYNNWLYICEAVTDEDSDWLTVNSASMYDLTDKSAEFETSKDLEFDHATSTTGTLSASWIKLLNKDGASVTIQNVSETFDITSHLEAGTSEKASTNYWGWIDRDRKKRLVPDITGTADSDVLNSLSVTGATFQTDLLHRWDKIYQTSDKTVGYVKGVTSETVLTCMDADGNDLDLFPDGNETFIIRKLSPEGLGQFKEAVGYFVNNSSSNIDDSFYTQIQEEKYYSETAGDFTATSANWTTSSAVISVRQINNWAGIGGWKNNFNIDGDLSVASAAANISISGTILSSDFVDQGISGGPASTGLTMERFVARTASNDYRITVSGGTETNYFISGDVWLNKKPTFHT